MKAAASLFVLSALVLAQQAYKIPSDEVALSAHRYSPGLVLRTSADLVEVPVTVRDNDRNPIAGLQAGNFELFDNGKPVPIATFNVETHAAAPVTVPTAPSAWPLAAVPAAAAAPTPSPAAAPRARYVVFYLDDLDTEPNDLANTSRAALTYLKTGIEPGDHVAIYSSAPASTLNFTTDLAKIEAALRGMSYHSRNAPDGGCPLITPAQAYEIWEFNDGMNEAQELAVEQALACYKPSLSRPQAEDYVREKAERVWGQTQAQSQTILDSMDALVNTLSHQNGDRALVLASSGFLTPTLQNQLDAIIENALHNRVVINGLDAKGLWANLGGQPPGFRSDDPIVQGNRFLQNANGYRDRTATWDAMQLSAGMAQMAFGTGGNMFENSNDLPGGFRQLVSPPSVSYVLSFKPPANTKPDGTQHTITVKVSGSAAHVADVQYRPAYFAALEDTAKAQTTGAVKQVLDQEIAGAARSEAIPAMVRPDATAGGLNVLVAVDPRHLAWKSAGGRKLDDLVFVTAALGPDGKVVAGEQGDMSLRLKDDTLAAVSRPGVGITAGLTLTLPTGAYQLRTVIREANAGALTVLTQPVTVR